MKESNSTLLIGTLLISTVTIALCFSIQEWGDSNKKYEAVMKAIDSNLADRDKLSAVQVILRGEASKN